MYQVEFLIEGYLLPLTLQRLRVGDHLLLELAFRGGPADLTGQSKFYSLAFVAAPEDGSVIKRAVEHLDFFLLIYALRSGQSPVHFTGIGTPLQDVKDLGKWRFTFPDFEKVDVQQEDFESEYHKPILSAKETFLDLIEHRAAIMKDYLGFSLRFYYFALQALEKRRRDETVIDLAVAAEAMVSTTRDKITENLKRRLSKLIAEDQTEREEIKRKLAEFYDARSAIMHSGHGAPALSEVRNYMYYVRKAIEKCLALRLFTKAELVTMLDSELSQRL